MGKRNVKRINTVHLNIKKTSPLTRSSPSPTSLPLLLPLLPTLSLKKEVHHHCCCCFIFRHNCWFTTTNGLVSRCLLTSRSKFVRCCKRSGERSKLSSLGNVSLYNLLRSRSRQNPARM